MMLINCQKTIYNNPHHKKHATFMVLLVNFLQMSNYKLSSMVVYCSSQVIRNNNYLFYYQIRSLSLSLSLSFSFFFLHRFFLFPFSLSCFLYLSISIGLVVVVDFGCGFLGFWLWCGFSEFWLWWWLVLAIVVGLTVMVDCCSC